MLPLFLLIVIGMIILWSFYLLYFKSPYFIVEDLIVIGRKSGCSVNYSDFEQMVVGRNIFKLDLSAIRSYMLNNYHELLNLQLTRAFPNTIIAIIALRKPIAELYQEYYYPVDQDGVILSDVKDYPDGKLPIISGIRADLSRQIGTITSSKRVKKALTLLKALNSSGILGEHTLVEIDISNIRNAIFFLEDGLEIKIGHENFALRLANLKKVLQNPKLRPADIRYIDLRFKEPVIGPRWKR
jgi:cell division septal protein FtsQ